MSKQEMTRSGKVRDGVNVQVSNVHTPLLKRTAGKTVKNTMLDESDGK